MQTRCRCKGAKTIIVYRTEAAVAGDGVSETPAAVAPPKLAAASGATPRAGEFFVPVGGAAIPADSITGQIAFPENLDRFFSRLQAIESGDTGQTVRVLQSGDKYTAAGAFSDRVRMLLQRKFGDGGAGFTYAGVPVPGYRVAGTSRTQKGDWAIEGLHRDKEADPRVRHALGLGGVASTSAKQGSLVSLDAPCSTLQVQYLSQPGGGGFLVTEDGKELGHLSTEGAVSAETFEAPCAAGKGYSGVHHFELETDSVKPVRLFGTVTERPGLTFEAPGVEGDDASWMLRCDQAVFTDSLKKRDPALIVLTFGMSETTGSYAETLESLVEMLHTAAPQASVLVMRQPNARVRSEAKRGRRQRKSLEDVDEVGEAEREACREHGCAFWSSDERAPSDRADLTRKADLFYSDLMRAYQGWAGLHPAPPVIIRSSQ